MSLTNSLVSDALYGEISHHQRKRTSNGFHQEKFTMHVATDVAARVLGISNIDLVIHYELPNGSGTSVHCSGRIGCVGRGDTAILMFTSS